MLKDTAGVELPPAAKKTTDLEGRVVKDAVREALKDRQKPLADLIHAVGHYRNLADRLFTYRGSDYAHAVQELNKAIDRAERFLR